MLSFTITGKLPNLNDYTRACRSNRYAGAKMKEREELRIKKAIWSQLDGQAVPGRVEIDFSWIEPDTRRDIDNIAFAKKFVLDALVSTGTIEGDNQKHVTAFHDRFSVDKEDPRVEVTIREVTE